MSTRLEFSLLQLALSYFVLNNYSLKRLGKEIHCLKRYDIHETDMNIAKSHKALQKVLKLFRKSIRPKTTNSPVFIGSSGAGNFNN